MHPSVVESVARFAATQPDKLAVADGAKALTYSQLWGLVRNRAELLRDRGIGRDSYVMVGCNQSADYLSWMLAAHLAGAIAVPTEKNASLSRLEEIAHDTGACLFVAKDPDGLGNVPFLDIADEGIETSDQPSDLRFPEGDDIAEILYSTGTTGKSKGIVITHRNNMAIAENVIEGLQMGADNVEIVPMPLSHSHGLRRCYSSLVNGSTAVIADGVLALKKMFNLMDEYGVTSMDISPSMLSIIFKLSKDRLGDYADALDYVQLGSAPLPEDSKARIAELLPHTRLYNFYGSTEAGCSCLLEFNAMSDKPGCVGKPAVNAHFIVVDENRNPIESSETNLGFLASSGDINMLCYFKAPELTAETMQDGYIYTKDLGYIGEDGLVYMLGRKDDVINFGGVKISPEEVESAVIKNPIVRDCACVPAPDEISGQIPVLFLALEEGAEYDMTSFKKFLAEAIDANKQPQRIEMIDEIPRTFNGKIKRNELTARFA